MKFRYLVLSIVLFQMASIFGASTAAAPAPEADTKAADTKQTAANTTSTTRLAGRGIRSHEGLLTEQLYKRWVGENMCPYDPACDPGFDNPSCHCYALIPHCDMRCAPFIENDINPCRHMLQRAENRLKTMLAHGMYGFHGYNRYPGISKNSIFTITPLPHEASEKITAAVGMIPREVAHIIAFYLPDPAIRLTLICAWHTSGTLKLSCTYNLDTDQLAVHRTTYHPHDLENKWPGYALVVDEAGNLADHAGNLV